LLVLNNGVKKFLFVINSDWGFLLYRTPLAIAAKNKGIQVWVASPDTGDANKIIAMGFNFIELPMSRKGVNILNEFFTFLRILKIYYQLKPDLIHHVTIKPIIYGTIASAILNKAFVVNAISGLGFTFSSGSSSRLLKFLVKNLLKISLKYQKSKIIFQNPDDFNLFIENKLISSNQGVLIKGSGVDCKVFSPSLSDFNKEKIVILPSRMIVEKGIYEFVDAARLLHLEFPNVRFVLVGKIDSGNPSSIDYFEIMAWEKEGILEWWGHQSDMVTVLNKGTMVVLPTFYGEGLPKVLLEAAACSKPIISTNVPGCKEIVRHEVNGLLIPPKDEVALAEAIRRLLDNPEFAKQLGENGREIVKNEFSEELVVEKTFEVYDHLLAGK
jgi:glycosyltransferase involved in cell wall biosynthesis